MHICPFLASGSWNGIPNTIGDAPGLLMPLAKAAHHRAGEAIAPRRDERDEGGAGLSFARYTPQLFYRATNTLDGSRERYVESNGNFAVPQPLRSEVHAFPLQLR